MACVMEQLLAYDDRRWKTRSRTIGAALYYIMIILCAKAAARNTLRVMSWNLKNVGSGGIGGREPAAARLNPSPPFRDIFAAGLPGAFACGDKMEHLFEFMLKR